MKVAVLAYSGVSLFELSCAVELFGLPRPELSNGYECDVVSFSDEQCASTSGVGLQVTLVESIEIYDMLVVPSWPTNKPLIDKAVSESLLAFYQSGKRIISFCSGAFLLAQLGILDGRKATTHWRYAGVFIEAFPNVEYVDDVLYVYDGQVGCSAGSAAGLDLGLEVVRRDHGYDQANRIARRLVVSAHRAGGQSQFIERAINVAPSALSRVLDWAQANLAQRFDINDLAMRANMSRRTFDRQFKLALGLSPNEWLIRQRIQLAKSFLERETCGIEKVAELVGFEQAVTLRHHFRRHVGISPRQYRQQFTAHS